MLYTVTPCRLLDTRNPTGPYGGPAAGPGAIRSVDVAGQCGVPLTAKAVVLNVTAVAPPSGGWLTLFPGASALPNSSTINYRTGKTRANNAVVSLSGGGVLNFYNSGPNAVEVIIDISGYFQ